MRTPDPHTTWAHVLWAVGPHFDSGPAGQLSNVSLHCLYWIKAQKPKNIWLNGKCGILWLNRSRDTVKPCPKVRTGETLRKSAVSWHTVLWGSELKWYSRWSHHSSVWSIMQRDVCVSCWGLKPEFLSSLVRTWKEIQESSIMYICPPCQSVRISNGRLESSEDRR